MILLLLFPSGHRTDGRQSLWLDTLPSFTDNANLTDNNREERRKLEGNILTLLQDCVSGAQAVGSVEVRRRKNKM